MIGSEEVRKTGLADDCDDTSEDRSRPLWGWYLYGIMRPKDVREIETMPGLGLEGIAPPD